jgi:sugar/nucleoside kinase (ribokinase family)
MLFDKLTSIGCENMNKKYDVVVVGELNIDLVLWNVPMPENEKEKLAENMRFAMGSSSAITAHNLAALGTKVAFIGKAGNDVFGDFMLDQLQNGGVDTSYVIRDPQLKTGATIVLANPPKKALLTYMGAMTELRLADINRELLAQARHLHVGCFFLQTGIRKDVGKLFAEAKQMGMTTSMDTNWDPDENWGDDLMDALDHTDVFFPNDDEALRIARTETIDEAIHELGQRVKILAIKRGSEGATVYTDKETHSDPGFSVKAVETTGAGDSFNAGFLHKYLQQAAWPECLQYANACGAVAVTAIGGTTAFQDQAELMKNLNNILK